MVQSTRRSFLIGLGTALVAAPAIVRAGSLMPVKAMTEPVRFAFTEPLNDIFYFKYGMRILKSVNGSGWVDVSPENFILRESCV